MPAKSNGSILRMTRSVAHAELFTKDRIANSEKLNEALTVWM